MKRRMVDEGPGGGGAELAVATVAVRSENSKVRVWNAGID